MRGWEKCNRITPFIKNVFSKQCCEIDIINLILQEMKPRLKILKEIFQGDNCRVPELGFEPDSVSLQSSRIFYKYTLPIFSGDTSYVN